MINIQKVKSFALLGNWIHSIDSVERHELYDKCQQQNPWFTNHSLDLALTGISNYLNEDYLKQWVEKYEFKNSSTKTIALVLAGNIPLVGFHDILCVLLSGNKVMVKLSSKDAVLIPYMLTKLIEIDPFYKDKIEYVEMLKGFDAVIATGSDNSSRYFDFYFRKYPHIIRKNRTSIAILDGFETEDDIIQLGKDVFSYFGLGCRNVSKVWAPKGYDFTTLLKAWEPYYEIINHHKYKNNYDYQLAILMINRVKFFDNGFVLLVESEKMVSPISVLYTEHFESKESLNEKLQSISDKTQCIVGNQAPATVKLGEAQLPGLSDYADHIDTMKFLAELG